MSLEDQLKDSLDQFDKKASTLLGSENKSVGAEFNLEFIKPEEYQTKINVLLYGPPGTSKTTGATFLPGPLLFLNAEGPNATMFARQLHGNEKFLEYPITCKADLDKAYVFLRQNPKDVRSVVLDKIGELYRILTSEMVENRGQTGMPDQRMYGEANIIIEKFCRILRNSVYNTVLIADEQVDHDELTGEGIRMPATGGKQLPRSLTGMVDVVGYTGAVISDDGVRYVSQLVSARGRYGKDRTGKLGVVADTNVGHWLEVMKGNVDGEDS